jgi:hypothetical protein
MAILIATLVELDPNGELVVVKRGLSITVTDQLSSFRLTIPVITAALARENVALVLTEPALQIISTVLCPT